MSAEPVVYTDYLPKEQATVITVAAGEWQERLWLSDTVAFRVRHTRDLVNYHVSRMVPRVQLFDRLVREDRDW